MNNCYTPEDMLLYIYNEMEPKDRITFEEQLQKDEQLMEQFQQLLEAKQSLPKMDVSPSKTSIDIIMEFSAKTQGHTV